MFKKIRSLAGRLFSEKNQMIIIIFLSNFYWMMRKYFLSVVIDYPEDYEKNWKNIKTISSQDKERNFTVFQMVNLHNEFFKDQETNVIEFGVDRGATISTISRFVKPKTKIYALDSFGKYASNIKENISDFDPHYKGSYKPFTKETRFKEFNYKDLESSLNSEIEKKNCLLKVICCHFPDQINPEDFNEINTKKFSFVHFDFDLYTPTLAAIKFIEQRLEKNAILLFDDYNFLNQEGVKAAVKKSGINLNRCVQTQSGQLICYL